MTIIIEYLIPTLSLTLMEIALSVDNLIVLSLLIDELPKALQSHARRWGLRFALLFRAGFVACLNQLKQFEKPLFSIHHYHWSTRDLILVVGGFFLVYKATVEIHERIAGHTSKRRVHLKRRAKATHAFIILIIAQIIWYDFVFSIDSMITAIGMADRLGIMLFAMVISMAVMSFFSEQVSSIIKERPSLKILAFAFLLLIGISLVSEGLGSPIPKMTLYITIGFSLMTELLMSRTGARKH